MKGRMVKMTAGTKFMLSGIAVTPIFLALAVYDRHGITPVLFFPWSMYSMGLRRIALPFDSIGAPWIHELVIAALQYPVYGLYLGKDMMGKLLAERAVKLFMVHFALVILAIYALQHQ